MNRYYVLLITRYYRNMMLNLSSPVTELSGIGPAKAKLLEKLDIRHVRDLLFAFPYRYEDFSTVTLIKDLLLGKSMTVRGKIVKVKSSWGFQGKRRLLRIYVDLADETGILHVTWYNLRFLEKQLVIGREMYVAGNVEAFTYKGVDSTKVHFSMRSPAMEFLAVNQEQTHTAAITPIYSETKGVSSRFIRYQIKKLLPLTALIPEYLPADIIKRQGLVSIHTALQSIHFPQHQEELKAAEKRLHFDELFFLQLAALVRRRSWQQLKALPIPSTKQERQHAIKKLPFSLTSAQAEAFEEIMDEMGKDQPMNRLLQGDVGSGKSAVALLATQLTLQKGYQVLYLAPTEILARQQAKHFTDFLGKHQVELLVGALPEGEKQHVKDRLRAKDVVCVVGTHALLQDDVQAGSVGLVIVDEQHRFGVAQRSKLLGGGTRDNDERSHLLSMTATPIPRTLNLTVYGDLDVSVLNELPPGRQPIKTKVISPAQQSGAIVHVLEELHRGHQGYIITPLIEDSEKLQIKSAKKAFQEVTHWFPGVAVDLLHGNMTSEEKETVMENFAVGATQLLVSTAVVEVGVNVPNATIMIIEGAQRFGLSQLHQFRGRIGRDSVQSYCYLFPTTDEDVSNPRLQVLASTCDGFKIAEEDLRLRGPGEMYGVAQSGFGDLKVASLLDYPLIKQARTEAAAVLKKDPELQTFPILRKKVEQKNKTTHFE